MATSRAARKFVRTMTLAVLALGALIWSAIHQFGLAAEDMLPLLYGTLLVAGLVILLAGLVLVSFKLLRRLLRKDSR